MAARVMVVSWVTRLVTNDAGEATEQVLFYTPTAKRRAPYPHNDLLEYCFAVTIALPSSAPPPRPSPGPNPNFKPDLALLTSHHSIHSQSSLQTLHSLHLIRRSKRIAFPAPPASAAPPPPVSATAPPTHLEAFLYRVSDSYTRGQHYESFRHPQGGPLACPDDVPADEFERDLAEFHWLEARVGGPHWHSWVDRAHFSQPFALESEADAAAFGLVFLPAELESALNEVKTAQAGFTHTELAELALEVLFDTVTSRAGRYASRSWPPDEPPLAPDATALPAAVIKFRAYRYWLDVVAHYLLDMIFPPARTILTSVLLRVFQPVQPLVALPAASVDNLERAALRSLAAELARAERAREAVAKLACGRILHFASDEESKKRELIEVVALGGSEDVHAALRELVHTVLTLAAHPYSSLHPSVSPMLGSDEARWNAIPHRLHITLGETGPGLAGLALARSIHETLETSTSQLGQLDAATRTRTRTTTATAGTGGANPELVSLAERLRLVLQATAQGEEAQAAPAVTGGLRGLLGAADEAARARTAVTIEIVPDGAIAAAIRSASKELVVLIGADKVLPRGGDVVARMGSRTLAECGKAKGKWDKGQVGTTRVYALASTAVFESTPDAVAFQPSFGPPVEVVRAWVASVAVEDDAGATSLDTFTGLALDDKYPNVKLTHQLDELVPGSLIDCWITDAGLLSGQGCELLADERGAAERAMFGPLSPPPQPAGAHRSRAAKRDGQTP